MARKESQAIQWWDRGRERWRARPEKKKRSYEERVGARRRPAREVYAVRCAAVRPALAQHCVDRDQEQLDRALLRDHAASRAQWRWKHSVTRSERIVRALERRAGGFLRQVQQGRGRWLTRDCFTFAAYLNAGWTERFEIERELAAALREHLARPFAKRSPLSEDPRLQRYVPGRGMRLKVAKRLLIAAYRARAKKAHDRARAALRGLVDTWDVHCGRASPKRITALLAMRVAGELGLLPDGHPGASMAQRWRARDSMIRTVIERDPALRVAVERWLALNLPHAWAAQAMLPRYGRR